MLILLLPPYLEFIYPSIHLFKIVLGCLLYNEAIFKVLEVPLPIKWGKKSLASQTYILVKENG